MRRLALSFSLALAACVPATPAAQAGWDAVPGPSKGPTEVIGKPSAGCLAGAQALPADGPGWTVVRLERRRFYGHPSLVAFVRGLAARGRAEGLPPLVVGDMAQARGGPMPSGHRSHQGGLDVDLMFEAPPAGGFSAAARAAFDPVSAIDGTGAVLPARFGATQVEWLRLAATSPGVDRIFVNYRLKKQMCDSIPPDRRAWLHAIRPWMGHDAHFHVRLSCPADSPQCIGTGSAIPPGDGCGAELESWFAPPETAQVKPKPAEPPPAPALPEACAQVLDPS